MDLLLKQETLFSKWVVKYHNLLNNRDAEEILNTMYNDKLLSFSRQSQSGFTVDLKNRIFSAILFDFLYEDAKQYYATSNTLEVIKIKKEQYPTDFEIELFKEGFLSEINQDTKCILTVGSKKDLFMQGLLPLCTIYKNGHPQYSSNDLPEIANNLIEFFNENTKICRINNFTILLKAYINDLSETKTSKVAKNKLIKLFELKNHNNKQHIPMMKGFEDQYKHVILPFEQLLTIENINYDIQFYNDLAKGSININEENLRKWQQLTKQRQKSLENIFIKLKRTPRTFIEHAIIFGSFGINAIMPDLLTHYIDAIIPISGWKNRAVTALSLIASLVLNFQLGQRFFPKFYAKFNSHTPLIKACIKEEEYINKERTYEFFLPHFVHIFGSLIGNKCLSCISLPAKIIGVTIHGLRLILYFIATLAFTDSRNNIYKAKHLKTENT